MRWVEKEQAGDVCSIRKGLEHRSSTGPPPTVVSWSGPRVAPAPSQTPFSLARLVAPRTVTGTSVNRISWERCPSPLGRGIRIQGNATVCPNQSWADFANVLATRPASGARGATLGSRTLLHQLERSQKRAWSPGLFQLGRVVGGAIAGFVGDRAARKDRDEGLWSWAWGGRRMRARRAAQARAGRQAEATAQQDSHNP